MVAFKVHNGVYCASGSHAHDTIAIVRFFHLSESLLLGPSERASDEMQVLLPYSNYSTADKILSGLCLPPPSADDGECNSFDLDLFFIPLQYTSRSGASKAPSAEHKLIE